MGVVSGCLPVVVDIYLVIVYFIKKNKNSKFNNLNNSI